MDRQVELAKRLLESKGYNVTEKLAVGQTDELNVDNVDLGYITLDGTEYYVVSSDDLDMKVEPNTLDTYFLQKETGVVLELLPDSVFNDDEQRPEIAKVKRIR